MIAALRFRRVNTEKAEFDGRSAAPDTPFDPAAADLVEHGDLFERAQRMIEVEEHDQRAEAKPGRVLCHGGQEQIG